MKKLTVEKRQGGWAFVVTVDGESQERKFWYKADAEKAMEEFKDYNEFKLKGEFNHYFRPISK